jgi:uncharacterized protein YjiS (DUF1127 family)
LPHRLATGKGGWTPNPALAGLPWRLVATLLGWQARADQRAALAALDDRMLEDVGLSRAEVTMELAKPFWRA